MHRRQDGDRLARHVNAGKDLAALGDAGQALGSARSRILPVRLEGDAPPKGTEIRSGGKQLGTLLSAAGRDALALIRLDRLAEAEGPLLADGVALTVRKPSWARYDVPGAA